MLAPVTSVIYDASVNFPAKVRVWVDDDGHTKIRFGTSEPMIIPATTAVDVEITPAEDWVRIRVVRSID